MLTNFIFFVYTTIRRNQKIVTRIQDFGYCFLIGSDDISDFLYTALVVCSEVLSSVLVARSSGTVIVILYRCSRGSNTSTALMVPTDPPLNPELPRTSSHNYLHFWLAVLSCVLRGCIALLHNHSWWLMSVNHLISLCFPSSAPFALTPHYSIVSRFSFHWLRKK